MLNPWQQHGHTRLVVEHHTPKQEVLSSIPHVVSLSKTLLLPTVLVNTHETVTLSQYD